ncbi:carboxymuconolactone decarboxylase family protein [Betaproteobacteria bacterium PRO7]|nr:carboxymuconolactone decarboxylase family protein [Betaproteobacteria bacterium PRO7]
MLDCEARRARRAARPTRADPHHRAAARARARAADDPRLLGGALAPHVTQCPSCIRSHARAASRAGATDAQIREAHWVAAQMRTGAAFAHSALSLAAIEPANCTTS